MEWVQSALGSLRSKFAPENPLKTPVQPSAGMKRMNERTSQEHPMLPFARDTMNMVFPGVGNVFSPLTNRALHAMDIQDEVAYEAGARTQDALDFLPSPLPEIAATGVYTAGNVFDPVPGPNPAMVFYHGSPHKFSKFSSKAIGSGEGNQAYGHGLYFAENPDVGGTYRTVGPAGQAGTRRVVTKGGEFDVPDWLGNVIADKGVDDAIAEWSKRVSEETAKAKGSLQPWIHEANAKRLSKELDQLREAKKVGVDKVEEAGNLYTVDIPDEAVDRMLDWDAPLSEQPEAVRDAFNRLGSRVSMDEPIGVAMDRAKRNPMFAGDLIGRDRATFVEVSEALKEAGIPGIKYFDGNSRAAGEGTRNVVVFDDSIIKVLSRNGEPVE